MFFLRELYYQLFRKKARTVLAVCLAALLTGCVALYLGNIYANEALLANAGEAVQVRFDVVSGDGIRDGGLNIPSHRVDSLLAAPVKDIMCNVVAAGAFSEEARAEDPFSGGDITIAGGNCLEATGVPARGCEFADGVDASIFESREAVCVADSFYAQEYGWDIGSNVAMPVYIAYWSDSGISYRTIGELSLEVVGILDHNYAGPSMTALFVPIEFMRQAVEDRGLGFFYASFSAAISDPMKLNEFKASLEPMGFHETSDTSMDQYAGEAIRVDDEMFIDTVSALQGNLRTFRAFEIPFFALILCLTALSTFLMMRGDKMEIALQRSMGQTRLRIGLVRLTSVFVTDLAGCGAAYAAMRWTAAIGAGAALVICAAFLGAAAVGSIIAVGVIVRGDVLSKFAGNS